MGADLRFAGVFEVLAAMRVYSIDPDKLRGSEALREHLMSAGELFRSNALQGMPFGPESTQIAELFEDLVA
jgi:hypothetical protein